MIILSNRPRGKVTHRPTPDDPPDPATVRRRAVVLLKLIRVSKPDERDALATEIARHLDQQEGRR